MALQERTSSVDLEGWGGKKIETTARCLSPRMVHGSAAWGQGEQLGMGEAAGAVTSV